MNDQEVWLRAWLAVASCFNGKEDACTRYADRCLADFRKRFPAQVDGNPKGGDGTAPSQSDDSPVGEADAP